MKVGDYGIILYLYTSFDMVNNTALALSLTSPTDTVITRVPTLGVVPLTPPGATLAWPAYQWVQYATKLGDITVSGTWSAQVIYTDPSNNLSSQYVTFQVQS